MAKIDRKLMKVFGSTAGASELGVFGSLAAGSPTTTTDPETIQSLANYLEGWYSAVVGGNSPAIEDMNALHYLFGYQLAYLLERGVPEWNSLTTYYEDCFVSSGPDIYVSLTDNNLNNAVSNPTHWAPLTKSSLNWLSTRTYSEGDLVLNDDGLYISLQASNTGNDPSDSPSYWGTFRPGALNPQVTPATALYSMSTDNSPTLATVTQVNKVIWHEWLGLYILCSSHSTTTNMATSPTGLTWTTRTGASNRSWLGMAAATRGDATIMCCSDSSSPRFQYSTDGVTWTGHPGVSAQWMDMAYSPELDLFGVIARTGPFETIDQSLNESAAVSSIVGTPTCIIWCSPKRLWVVGGSTGTNKIAVSADDGASFTQYLAGTMATVDGLAYSPELEMFVGVSQNGPTYAIVSRDGITWEDVTAPAGVWRSVVWARELGCFIAAGDGQTMHSFDGFTWVDVATTDPETYVSIAWSAANSNAVLVANTGTSLVERTIRNTKLIGL